jgi:hypothetical protein
MRDIRELVLPANVSVAVAYLTVDRHRSPNEARNPLRKEVSRGLSHLASATRNLAGTSILGWTKNSGL